MKTRVVLLMLVLAMLLPVCVQADSGEWTCPECGQAGNTGNFCSNCATPRPAAAWTCPDCGQQGNTGNFCSNCGAKKPAGSTAAVSSKVNTDLEQIPGETDRVKVIANRIEASSYIANKKDPGRWRPENAADGNETTCWQFSSRKGLKGKSWISLAFDRGQTVDEVWFKNGFWAVNDKGGDQYTINSRLKGVRVEFLYAGESKFRDGCELTLRDESRKGWQQFAVGHHENVVSVRIAALTIYKGSHFEKDVCLSEVMAVRNAPASGAMPAQGQQAEVVYESRPEVSGAPLLDKIATRYGPGTEYGEPGTFFIDNWQKTVVKVTGKHWDGSIWWVQVDFDYGRKGSYRVWTGLKRVDVDIDRVKENKPLGTLHVDATEARCGPGKKYAKMNDVLFFEDGIEFFAIENGYVEIDYYDVNREIQRRCWVPQSAVSDIRRY